MPAIKENRKAREEKLRREEMRRHRNQPFPSHPNKYQPLHAPRFPNQEEERRSKMSGYCYLHQSFMTGDFYVSCPHCKAEFDAVADHRGDLPEQYSMYADIMWRSEWYWLKVQDKYVQFGFLTETEARENKYDFLENYCVPVWRQRIIDNEANARHKAQQEQEQKTRREPAKPIW